MTQRCQHVDALKRILEEEGATDIYASREGGKVRLSWRLAGRPYGMTVAATPRDPVNARRTGRQAVYRLCPGLRAS